VLPVIVNDEPVVAAGRASAQAAADFRLTVGFYVGFVRAFT